MKKQYKLTALALTACLLTGCGAGETSALENTTAEKQSTEPVAETSAETFPETASAGNHSTGKSGCTQRNYHRLHRNRRISPGGDICATLFPEDFVRDEQQCYHGV